MLRMLVNAGRIQQAGTNSLLGIARSNIQWKLTRDALQVGTMGGATVLGIADQVGSLTPGKRADVILVRMDQLNMLPARGTDPVVQMVQHGLPSNVDSVWIDGILRKHRGQLVGVDVSQVIADAAKTQEAVLERAGMAYPPSTRFNDT